MGLREFFKKNIGYTLSLALASSLAIYTSLENNNQKRNIQDRYLNTQNVGRDSSYILFPFKRDDVIIPIKELIPLYSDCDQQIYTTKTKKPAKTREEIIKSIERRRSLEEIWTGYFNLRKSLDLFTRRIDETQTLYDPLNGLGEIKDNFNDFRIRAGRWRERHKAEDIFADLGIPIYAPVSGLVIAAADDWDGFWDRKKKIMVYNRGGLGELSGNGVLLFNPVDRGYHLLIHMESVFVRAGEIVSRGQEIGTVGKTGNAISPKITSHLHYSYKLPGTGCGIDGVLVAQNPFWILAANRRMSDLVVNVDEPLY